MHLLDALNNSLPEVFRAIDLMGVLLNGILGGKVARERNFDAVGMVLGCWSATGAIKTLDAGFAIMPAILMGIMTAIGGGMVRDISAGLVPRVFGGNNLYATPAFACSLVTVIFWYMGQPVLGMGASIIVGLVFTGMAHWRRWKLPQTREWTITLTYSQLKALRGGRR